MSFASEIKDELALNLPDKKNIKYELSALFKGSGSLVIKDKVLVIVYRIENAKVAQRVYKIVESLYNIKCNTSIAKKMKLNNSTIYSVIINKQALEILKDLGIASDDGLDTFPVNILKDQGACKSFLAGAFMSTGSVNSPLGANYHLEIAVTTLEYAVFLIKVINKMNLNLNAKIIKRRSLYIVYIKKAQCISDFLSSIGALNGMMRFEETRIEKDLYNNTNRLNNCDVANELRAFNAANEQVRLIKLVINKTGINYFPSEDLRVLAKLRLDNQEDTLKELVLKFNDIMGKNMTKSGINHLFDKIKLIAKEFEER